MSCSSWFFVPFVTCIISELTTIILFSIRLETNTTAPCSVAFLHEAAATAYPKLFWLFQDGDQCVYSFHSAYWGYPVQRTDLSSAHPGLQRSLCQYFKDGQLVCFV